VIFLQGSNYLQIMSKSYSDLLSFPLFLLHVDWVSLVLATLYM